MLYTKVRNFLSQNKKYFYYFAFFLVLFGLSGEVGFATEEEIVEVKDLQKVIGWVNIGLAVIASFLSLLTSLVGMFLSPGWYTGSVFNFDIHLKQMWILVSNIVYFIFAFLLIFIAFMNIIGKEGDKYQLKKALPKFIVGVLIVPFSWFFVQFVLSLASVLTISVLSLPYDMFSEQKLVVTSDGKESEWYTRKNICKNWLLNVGNLNNKSSSGAETKNLGGAADKNAATGKEVIDLTKGLFQCVDKDGKPIDDYNKDASSYSGGTKENFYSIETLMSGEGDSLYSIMSLYTYGVMRLQDVDQLDTIQVTSIGTGLDVLFKVLFDGLFVVVYFILMVALFLALFTRGVYLWFYAMLSPIFGLFFFFDKKDGGGGEMMKKFNIQEFFHLAMLPVYVGGVLAFGMFFIMVAGKVENASHPAIGDKIEVGGMSLTISALVGKSGGTAGGTARSAEGGGADGKKGEFHWLAGGGSAVSALLLRVFGLAILWVGMMAALSKSEVTKSVIEPIKQFGDSVGKLAASAPKYTPIIPTGSGMMSTTGLQSFGSTTLSSINASQTRKGSELSNQLFGEPTGTRKAIQNYNNSPIDPTYTTDGSLHKDTNILISHLDSSTNETDFKAVIKALIDKKVLKPDAEKNITYNMRNDSKNLSAKFLENLSDKPRADWYKDAEKIEHIIDQKLSPDGMSGASGAAKAKQASSDSLDEDDTNDKNKGKKKKENNEEDDTTENDDSDTADETTT